MKKQQQIIRHGEIIMKQVEFLPEGAKLISSTKEKIVAHSETGHHHVLTATKPFNVYEHDGQTYIITMTTADLWHQKTGKDVHTTHTIQPAIYKLVLKKEFNYYTGILAAVRD